MTNLKFRNFSLKLLIFTILLSAFIFCGKSTNALSIYSIKSPLIFFAFPETIVGYSKDIKGVDWESANMENSDVDNINIEFKRKGWSGNVKLPNNITLFPEEITLKFFNKIDPAFEGIKEIRLSNIKINGNKNKINEMKLNCNVNDNSFYISFSYFDKTLNLYSKGDILDTFQVQEDKYSLKQIFALEVSILMEYILN